MADSPTSWGGDKVTRCISGAETQSGRREQLRHIFASGDSGKPLLCAIPVRVAAITLRTRAREAPLRSVGHGGDHTQSHCLCVLQLSRFWCRAEKTAFRGQKPLGAVGRNETDCGEGWRQQWSGSERGRQNQSAQRTDIAVSTSCATVVESNHLTRLLRWNKRPSVLGMAQGKKKR